ncbi:hypothetical protein BVRB_8g187020 [Beta vulgaris subsp. vulgaris]|nr:hypothetical protein BVRB_8g187020 [Beta vulgaris subsp. vulgaris]
MELPNKLLIIFLTPIILIILPVSSQYEPVHEACSNFAGNYTANSTYPDNLDLLRSDLTNQASLSLFSNQTIGQGIDEVNGVYMCRGDFEGERCHDCVNAAFSMIFERCPVQMDAIMWLEDCMVRYANRPIFSREEEEPYSYAWLKANVSNPLQLGEIITTKTESLIMPAAYNTSMRGYASGQTNVSLFEDVYLVTQCTPDILGPLCERCLKVALRNIGVCCGPLRTTMIMMLPSCWLRYAHEPFVKDIDSSPPGPPLSTSLPPTRPSIELDDLPIFPPPSSPGNLDTKFCKLLIE